MREELARIYDITPDNICGMAYGYKTKDGITGSVPSVIFYVTKKLDRRDIPSDEVIPRTVKIGDVDYTTDVVEMPPGHVRTLATCFANNDQSDPEIARLQGHPQALIPMRGGQEIVMFPSLGGWYGGAKGTLGFFAIDNLDGKVVGVTNTHVAVDPTIYAGDITRAAPDKITQELLEPTNTIEPRYWYWDGKKYPAGALVRDGNLYVPPSAYMYHQAAMYVKRYAPVYTKSQTQINTALINKIDAALLVMNDGKFAPTGEYFVDHNSRSIWRTSDMDAALQDAPAYPLATRDEINALATQHSGGQTVYVYVTGRTTGPKGYCPTRRMRITSFVAVADFIGGYSPHSWAKFENTLEIRPAVDAVAGTLAALGGDSGSAILADVIDTTSGELTRKIVGILFAGPSDGSFTWACRIDNVAEELQISSWTMQYPFDRAISLAVPKPKVITQSIADAGLNLSVTRTEDGIDHKYWQAGLTLQNYPPRFEEGLYTLALSETNIYENNLVGQIVGYLSVINSDTETTVIDAYSYALVPGTGATDNAAFTIFGNQLRAAIEFNYENKTEYSVRVRATNTAGIPIENQFTITIGNINDFAPTDITLTQATQATGPAGRFIGTLAATSPDPADSFTYFLVSGPGSEDNSWFAISGASLFTTAAVTSPGTKTIRVQTRNNYNFTFEKSLPVTFL